MSQFQFGNFENRWGGGLQGVSKKMSRSFYFISLATSSLESWNVSQIKADIHRYVLSTISFLCDIGKMIQGIGLTGQSNIA